MRKPAMTPGAFPHRGTAAPFRVAVGLALAAGAGTMLWGVGTHSHAFASEFGRNAERETPMTLEDRVAALTAELAQVKAETAQVKAETAKLRESQGNTSEELSHMRASLANAEIGLEARRTTTDENEARGRDTAAQIASILAQVKAETAKLRESQGNTSEELSHMRASLANAEIGLEARRTTTDENEARGRDTAAQIASIFAQVKAETAKLRESQGNTSEELSHMRASLANAEIGLEARRTTTDENEARGRDTAAQIASNLAQLKDDTATELGSLRAGVANSEIGVDALRATTGEIRQQIQRIEAARDTTSSIAKSHKRQGHRKWVAQR